MVRPNTQCARILHALADGRWHSVAEIHRKAGTSRLNSRISDLRLMHGYVIEHDTGGTGKTASTKHRYRLLTPMSEWEVRRLVTFDAPPVEVLDRKEIPRDDQHRFRIYRMVYDELELLATAPDAYSVGLVIVELGHQKAFGTSCIGLLDTHGTEEEKGTWILHPWEMTTA